MTSPARPAGADDDGYAFGDITASSISTSSVLSAPPGDPQAARRSAAVESDRRDALVRVAEHAAEIGLESAGALAAAAGVRLPARDTPVPRPMVGPPRRSPTPNPRPPVARRPTAAAPRPPRVPLPGPARPRRGEAGLGGRVVRVSTPPARVGQQAARPPARVISGPRLRRGPWLALAMLALVAVLVARALIR